MYGIVTVGNTWEVVEDIMRIERTGGRWLGQFRREQYSFEAEGSWVFSREFENLKRRRHFIWNLCLHAKGRLHANRIYAKGKHLLKSMFDSDCSKWIFSSCFNFIVLSFEFILNFVFWMPVLRLLKSAFLVPQFVFKWITMRISLYLFCAK